MARNPKIARNAEKLAAGTRQRPDRRKGEAMPSEDYNSTARAAVEAAANNIAANYAEDRERGLRYYRGETDIEKIEGRSGVVQTDVRDSVDMMLPQLMRVFLSSHSVCEFQAASEAVAPYAVLQTEYCNHLLYDRNNGFILLHDFIKDALTQKLGVFKVSVDEKEEVTFESFRGLTEDELDSLLADKSVSIVSRAVAEQFASDPFAIDEEGEAPPDLYDVTVKRKAVKKSIGIACIPPGEFITAHNMRSLEDGDGHGHDRLVTRSYLVELGYDREKVYGLTASNSSNVAQEGIEQAQKGDSAAQKPRASGEEDPSRETVRCVEWYWKIDRDGDGIAEWRKTVLAGEELLILDDAPAEDGIMFVAASPFRITHSVVGESLIDLTTDFQDISTALMRAVIDNLNFSNVPRIAYVESQVEAEDIVDHQPGAGIRMRQPGMVQALNIPFTAGGTMPILEYFEARKEMRTGLSRASAGLDADALQSSTEVGVRATVGMALLKVEMIARVLAETGIGPLFKILARLAKRHFPDGDVIAQNNTRFQQVDTAAFDPDMMLRANVGLGNGAVEQRQQMLGMIMMNIEKALANLGPDANPVTSFDHYRNAIADMMALFGMRDVGRYFKENPQANVDALAKAKAQQPPPEDPKIALEKQKLEMQMQAQQAKMQMDQQAQQERQQLDVMKAQQDMQLAEAKQAHDMQLAERRLENELQLAQVRLQNEMAMQQQKLQADIQLEAAKMAIGARDGQGDIPEEGNRK